MEELILKEREFREKLANLVNESKLPAMIIKPVLKEALEQILVLEQQQYENIKKNGGENNASN